MTNVNDSEPVAEIHNQAQAGTSSMEPAPVYRVPDTMEQILEFCINGARGDDGKVRGEMKPVAEADLKKRIEDMKATAERWPMNTPEQRIDYMINGATWLNMNRRRSKDTAMEDQNCGSVKPTEE